MQAVIQLQQAKLLEHKRGSVPSGDKSSLEDREHSAVQTRRMLGETLNTCGHLLPHDPAVTIATRSSFKCVGSKAMQHSIHSCAILCTMVPCAIATRHQLCALTEHVAVPCSLLSHSPRAICVHAQLISLPARGCSTSCTILCCINLDTRKQLSVYCACNTEGTVCKHLVQKCLFFVAETALRSVESIRQDPFWMPSIASLNGVTVNGGNKDMSEVMHSEVMHHLVENSKCRKFLSAAILQRVQACYLPLVSKHR